MDLTIGEASRQSGVKVATIRFYEQRALLARAARSDGNRRLYGPADVARLRFVRHARDLGFTLDAIRDLLILSDQPDTSCAAADAIARRHLAAVDARMAQLAVLRAELQRMIDSCAGGQVAQCRVIESLSDHALCAADHTPEPGAKVNKK